MKKNIKIFLRLIILCLTFQNIFASQGTVQNKFTEKYPDLKKSKKLQTDLTNKIKSTSVTDEQMFEAIIYAFGNEDYFNNQNSEYAASLNFVKAFSENFILKENTATANLFAISAGNFLTRFDQTGSKDLINQLFGKSEEALKNTDYTNQIEKAMQKEVIEAEKRLSKAVGTKAPMRAKKELKAIKQTKDDFTDALKAQNTRKAIDAIAEALASRPTAFEMFLSTVKAVVFAPVKAVVATAGFAKQHPYLSALAGTVATAVAVGTILAFWRTNIPYEEAKKDSGLSEKNFNTSIIKAGKTVNDGLRETPIKDPEIKVLNATLVKAIKTENPELTYDTLSKLNATSITNRSEIEMPEITPRERLKNETSFRQPSSITASLSKDEKIDLEIMKTQAKEVPSMSFIDGVKKGLVSPFKGMGKLLGW
ncbi:MAG: hypothetical protein ABIA74_06230 [bacterium]